MTPQTNEEIAYEIDKFPNGVLVRKAIVKALDEKDTQISKLEANLKIAVEALENISDFADETSSCKVAHDTLSHLKSGGEER